MNNSQIKILQEILKNPGVNLRGIIRETKLSPNFVSNLLNNFVKNKIFKEERIEIGKKYLRRFSFNFDSLSGKDVFNVLKWEEKHLFFEKYPKLNKIFDELIENVGGLKMIIIYGSYARKSATKKSDIDLLFIGNIKDKNKIKEILVTLETEPSIKIEALQDFKKRRNDALHSQIIREGVIIFGSEELWKILGK